MTIPIYVRNRPEGLRHRALIRRWIVPRLRPGCRIPSAAWMGRFLHISAGEGARHMRRVLAEAGIQTETRGAWRDRRTYVVAVGRAEV
jgi:hypothetical protein